MSLLSVKELNVTGKRVLLRCDYNVPVKEGKIADDTRITETLPTLNYLIQNGARVIICSHLGRPKGAGYEEKYTLKPVAQHLSKLINKDVLFASDSIGSDAKTKAAALKDGEILLLENMRFYKEEEKNDKEFCRELASLADLFVNDAFGTAHRAHASTAGVVQHGFLKGAAGFLIEKEIAFLSKINTSIATPYVAIVGGAKVSDKIQVIKSLIERVNVLLIGGGMAFTFLAANGVDVGASLVEPDKKELASELLNEAAARGVKLLLPVDFTAAEKFPDPISAPVNCKYVDLESGGKFGSFMGLDIGKKTAALFAAEIAKAKTIVWNGPMGVAENPLFSFGTKAIGEAIDKTANDVISIVGGGDSAAAMNSLGIKKISHISTGGGAFLEFLEGKTLPGITVLFK